MRHEVYNYKSGVRVNTRGDHEDKEFLSCWKEIASFLSRSVRTVQRWEDENKLPVHRIGTGPRSPVFAFKEELVGWLREQDQAREKSRAA
jgi:hypothetical protein